jgi:protein-S-isoprenylcysteine O-methyltransferase Ste14
MQKLIAWFGGVAFVGSLALLAWWYLWRLGRPASGGGLRALAFDVALVTMFAAHHSLFARERVKRALAFIPAALVPSFYVWVASLLLMAIPIFWTPIGGELYDVDAPAAFAFAAVQIAGFLVSRRAVAGLDPLELAGIRQVMAPAPNEPPSRGLQVTGPYRVVRHPLYLGWVLMFFATPHMTIDRLAFASLTTIYLVVAVPWEERALRKSYGDAYATYAERVRWRIIPYLY